MKSILITLAIIAGTLPATGEMLEFKARTRVESPKGSGEWVEQEKAVKWEGTNTAIVICDMWNQHWCKGATERVAEMAPRMNEVIKAARKKGVFIIHAPSETMKFYEGTPARKRALEAPKAKAPVELQRWRNLDPQREGPLPIDDSDGGCDDEPVCKGGPPYPWTRQIAAIEISDEDGITDSTEAYNLLQQRGIDNVIVMGVHANMCVLGRPFSIRQMVMAGKNVLLMRDMTDTMYNSRSRPFVNHFKGTDLVVEHIEKYWCPSITSVEFLGGAPFHFSKDPAYARAQNEYSPRVKEGVEQAGPLSPADALASFTVMPGLEIEQVLSEPEVRQPLQLSWDLMGRLWVVQYIQYPEPAGLTLLSKDQFWRAVYDKVPQAPPKHFKGADKITIHEDTNGDGQYDRHKTFVEGLSIVTAVAQDKEGVWVLNPPYLLFFPDKNHDDVADANPEVHLAGFGLEDTHSVANSLRWGPDGWLYGAHGSTVTAHITRPGIDKQPIATMMGQHVWRYQPATRKFEIFAEGGGNAFGLEIDDKGRIFSGHNGGNTRGFYYPQGGYLQKGFEKHGQLANPYAFGYFKQMGHNNAERFTHTFIIYSGNALADAFSGKLFGIEPLQGRVVLSDIMPEGSTFRTKDLGYAVVTSDKYFKPVDIKMGPDGAIYIADWYDRQVTHTRNYEGQIDKSNGRVYRLKAPGVRMGPERLAGKTMDELAEELKNPNRWARQNALRAIVERGGPADAEKFRKLCLENQGQLALEALWAANLLGGVTDENAGEFLEHKDPHVRMWTVRLLGDSGRPSGSASLRLQGMAESEPHVEVRAQLAATARRLPAAQSLPIIQKLLAHSEDAADPYIPLLLWWALEAKADSDREAIMAMVGNKTIWELPLFRETIAPRLMKRFAMPGKRAGLINCAGLLRNAPPEIRSSLVDAFEESAPENVPLPEELQVAIAAAGGRSLAFRIREKDEAAIKSGIGMLGNQKAADKEQIEIAMALGRSQSPEAKAGLLKFAETGPDGAVKRAVMAGLANFDDKAIAGELLSLVKNSSRETRTTALHLLASRAEWARRLCDTVKSGGIPARSVPGEVVEKLRLYSGLSPRVTSLWGERRGLELPVVEEKIRHYSGIINEPGGDPFKGYEHFSMLCANCHKLFGEGRDIGPDLTPFDRDDLRSVLMNVVNPSGEIREGYEPAQVETTDGRSLLGFVEEEHGGGLVLRGLDGERTSLRNEEIKERKPGKYSLMPEGLLEALEDEQVRDLFAYIRSAQPLVRAK